MFEIGDICYYREWLGQTPSYVLIVGEVSEDVKEIILLQNGYKFMGKKQFLLPLDYFDKPVMYETNEVF